MTSFVFTPRRFAALGLALTIGLVSHLFPAATAQPPQVDKAVLAAEADRVALIKKVSPAVVSVCVYGGDVMGSGVLIDPEGYALTNVHVTEALGGPVLSCGLPDGVLYDAVVVGLDPVGDTALVKLLPKEPGKPFPFAELGDSDKVRVGDWCFTMGNPHGLALDFTPSVAYGVVSATNRYLKVNPRSAMEYTDAIQVETAVNSGNSGGPLFDNTGKVIGINSAAAIRRGAANAGMGIAISINQVKNFLGHLRAGLVAEHASLGAVVRTADADAELARLVVSQILDDSDAYRRGLRDGDQLVSFFGRPLTSTNLFKNVLGLYPKDWRVPVVYRRDNERKEILVRLQSLLPPEDAGQPPPPKGPMPPTPAPKPKGPDSPAGKLYVAKKGYANWYFNERERTRLLDSHRKHGDFATVGGLWTAEGTFDTGERKGDMRFSVTEGSDVNTVVTLKLNIEQRLEPLKEKLDVKEQLEPIGSGGLMMALYHFHRFLTVGPKGFEGEFAHAGWEPFYPPPPGTTPKSLADLRVDTEVIRTKHGPVECKWYFSKKDQMLLGFETFVTRDEDPCEVYLFDYKPVEGRMLPHRLEVRKGDKRYATLVVNNYTTNKTP